MSEEQVVRNCAPTLAGLKTGNLFACPYENREDLLDFLMPLYVQEGKSQLVIAVGCTGGAHRSVAIAEAIAEFLRQKKYQVDVNHRDIDLEQAHWKNA